MGVKSWLGWALWGRWSDLPRRRACARQGHRLTMLMVQAGPGTRGGRSCRCGEHRIWDPQAQLLRVFAVLESSAVYDVPTVVEVWTDHTEIEVVSYATPEEAKALAAWREKVDALPKRHWRVQAVLNRFDRWRPPARPPFMRDRMMQRWGLADSLGTSYTVTGGWGAPIGGTAWRQRRRFHPAVPPVASELVIADPSGHETRVDISQPGGA